jgi:hypothetical protein
VKVKIQVIIESDDGYVQDVEEVACLKRGTLSPEELGLNLAEAKEILQSVQRSMTKHQVGDYTAERINCPCCGRPRAQKGHHPVLFRTLFGKLTLSSLRLHHCDCRPTPSKTFSLLAELLPERTAPELLYLEAKWCTLVSFGMTFDPLSGSRPAEKASNDRLVAAFLFNGGVTRWVSRQGQRFPFLVLSWSRFRSRRQAVGYRSGGIWKPLPPRTRNWLFSPSFLPPPGFTSRG